MANPVGPRALVGKRVEEVVEKNGVVLITAAGPGGRVIVRIGEPLIVEVPRG